MLTGKAQLEYQCGQLSPEWQSAFKEPLIKAVKIYFDHDALEGVPRDKVIDPKRVLSSRFALTNKGGSDLAKGRLVLGGHRDPDAGKFPTLAPTAAALAHNLINFISVQMGWVWSSMGMFPAPFLQGKHLPPEREIYVQIPKGYPKYIEEYIRSKLFLKFREDLLRLTKGSLGFTREPETLVLGVQGDPAAVLYEGAASLARRVRSPSPGRNPEGIGLHPCGRHKILWRCLK